MPTKRTELMRKHFYFVADLIETYPEMYDQDEWGEGLVTVVAGSRMIECGSVACVAGHLGASLGLKPNRWTNGAGETVTDWATVHVPADLPEDFPIYFGLNAHKTTSVGSLVAAMLGLEWGEADTLFSGGMTAPDGDVPRLLRAMADGATFWEADGA